LSKIKENNELLKVGKVLPVMEMFYSIQGEGYMTGKASWFIRIGGCDIGCKWCDVKESWNAQFHNLIKVEEIINKIKYYNPSKSVVITGGEPLMYNLDYLCQMLKNEETKIHLETSGSYKLSGTYDWVCLSPKACKKPKDELLLMADELKIIIEQPDDFLWAEKNRKKVKEKCLLYLQPEWRNSEKMLPLIIEHVKKNPKWMISLQSHKYMNIP